MMFYIIETITQGGETEREEYAPSRTKMSPRGFIEERISDWVQGGWEEEYTEDDGTTHLSRRTRSGHEERTIRWVSVGEYEDMRGGE